MKKLKKLICLVIIIFLLLTIGYVKSEGAATGAGVTFTGGTYQTNDGKKSYWSGFRSGPMIQGLRVTVYNDINNKKLKSIYFSKVSLHDEYSTFMGDMNNDKIQAVINYCEKVIANPDKYLSLTKTKCDQLFVNEASDQHRIHPSIVQYYYCKTNSAGAEQMDTIKINDGQCEFDNGKKWDSFSISDDEIGVHMIRNFQLVYRDMLDVVVLGIDGSTALNRDRLPEFNSLSDFKEKFSIIKYNSEKISFEKNENIPDIFDGEYNNPYTVVESWLNEKGLTILEDYAKFSTDRTVYYCLNGGMNCDKLFILVEPFIGLRLEINDESYSDSILVIGTIKEFSEVFQKAWGNKIPGKETPYITDNGWVCPLIGCYVERNKITNWAMSVFINEKSLEGISSNLGDFISNHVKDKYEISNKTELSILTIGDLYSHTYGMGIYSMESKPKLACPPDSPYGKSNTDSIKNRCIDDNNNSACDEDEARRYCYTYCPPRTSKAGKECTDSNLDGVCDNEDECELEKCDFTKPEHMKDKSITGKDCCIYDNIEVNKPSSQQDVYDAYPRCMKVQIESEGKCPTNCDGNTNKTSFELKITDKTNGSNIKNNNLLYVIDRKSKLGVDAQKTSGKNQFVKTKIEKDKSGDTIKDANNKALANCYLYCAEYKIDLNLPSAPEAHLIDGEYIKWPNLINKQVSTRSYIKCLTHVQDNPDKAQQKACTNAVSLIDLSKYAETGTDVEMTLGTSSNINVVSKKLKKHGEISKSYSSASTSYIEYIGITQKYALEGNDKVSYKTGKTVSNPDEEIVKTINDNISSVIKKTSYNVESVLKASMSLNFKITDPYEITEKTCEYKCEVLLDKSIPGGDVERKCVKEGEIHDISKCYIDKLDNDYRDRDHDEKLENQIMEECSLLVCDSSINVQCPSTSQRPGETCDGNGDGKCSNSEILACYGCPSEYTTDQEEMKECMDEGSTEEACIERICHGPGYCVYEDKTDNKVKKVKCSDKESCTKKQKAESCPAQCYNYISQKYVNCDDNLSGSCEDFERKKYNCSITGIPVVYRTVDLENPFPGLTSTNGRPSGSNWLQTSIDKYILNNRGVTGREIFNVDPMYEVTLTPQLIRTIRDYNRNQEEGYNDFNMNCITVKENGIKTTGCISNFLEEIQENIITDCTRTINGDWLSCRKVGV